MFSKHFSSFLVFLWMAVSVCSQEVLTMDASIAHPSTRGGVDFVRRLELKQEVSNSEVKNCEPVEECEMCTFSDQKSMSACKETGRKQKMECTAVDGDQSKPVVDYFSCQYTEADEQFAMIRFQMMCLLLGVLALMNVRRQKRANASLFDQRKQASEAAAAKRRRRSSDYEEGLNGSSHSNPELEIEFSRIDEETVPLVETSSNPLAVI